jgi:hypothetical protein
MGQGMNSQHNDLDHVTKGDVDEGAYGISRISGNVLSCIGEEPRERNDGYGIACENDRGFDVSEIGYDSGWDEEEEYVRPRVACNGAQR